MNKINSDLNKSRNVYRALTLKLVAASVVATIGAPQIVHAQEGIELEEVVVTGIRSSLKRSLDVKRNSTQIVDAISAEDVGKFPDANVAESLQRITGVAIDRTGGEGQFITVRGLGPEFNTVLLNGRTLATDNDGREFSFDVLSSDIIQRAEVFKSAVPNLQSGGIGATVNIVTARPLESTESGVSFSASGIYDELSGETSPDLSLLGTWVNDSGTFGAVGGISYSDRTSQLDRVFTNGFSERSGATAVFAPENSSGLTAANVGALPAGTRVQQQVVVERDQQERERTTLNGGLQFRPSDKLEITLDALYTEFNVSSFASQFSGFFSPPFINPQIDGNGTVTAFNRPGIDFQNRNPAIAGTIGLSQNDNVITANEREAESYLVGANFKYDIADNFSVNLDFSTSNATRESTNPFVVLGALAPASPLIALPGDAEISTITNVVQAQDTSIQRLHFVNVARTQVEDDINEFKLGGDWSFGEGSLSKLSFGVAATDRTKERVLFDNFSPTQGGGIFCAFCGYTVDFDDAILSQVNLGSFLSGVSGADRVPTNFLNSTFEQAFAQLNSDAAIDDPNRPAGLSSAELRARRDAAAANGSIFGFYEPELNAAGGFIVEEEITSFFLNSEWTGDFGNTPWSANLGFRVARTETTSIGVDQPINSIRESAGDTQLNFDFAPSTIVAINNSYTNFLPSANIKLDIADDKVLRFAYSETVTRPTLTALGVSNTFGGRSNAPTSGGGNPNLEAFEASNFDASFEWYIDDITFVGVSAFYKDFDNFLESQTLPVARDIIIPAGNVSNPGPTDQVVSVNFQDTRTRNGETGNLSGLELALQKGWDNGLGASLNYTYVTSSIDRAEGSGASDCDYNGLSPNVLNLSGFYESDKWSARVSYNYRDEFLVQCFDVQSEPREREEFAQVDFSASYNINDSYQVFVEGINIFGETRRDFSRFSNRFLELEDTGARYTFGIRGDF